MKKMFFIAVMLSFLSTVHAQASLLVLKDGRNLTGDIIKKSASEVTIYINDVPLTFYKDEILFIDGKPFGQQSPAPEYDPDKEGLINQYLKIYPTDKIVLGAVMGMVPGNQWPNFLSYLNSNSDMAKFTELRKAGLREHLSAASLKAIVDFSESPEGQTYLKEIRAFNDSTMIELRAEIRREANAAMKQFNTPNKNDHQD